MSAAVVELDGITKTYRSEPLEVTAVDAVSLTIHAGDYLTVVGPSGSGKSTLMHIIGCLDVPTSGRYLLAGEDVATFDENRLADVRNARIGFVFQQFNLLASLTARRNVELPLVYAGDPPYDRADRAIAALERVGLGDRIDHRPNELSGGEQQRVAIARALVNEPTLILADEPTGNLDSGSTDDVLGLLDDLHAAGRTIALITHEHAVAARATRFVTLSDGQLADPDLLGVEP